MQIIIKYPRFKDTSKLLPTDYHCVKCGSKTVMQIDGEGDNYLGNDYVCTTCRTHFNIPSNAFTMDDDYEIIE